ncbi:hypothetical protein TKK_0004552 [Trichogramma kaykai]|uniref:Transmembrane protein 237 n=1 Tax=Trichogramma kaykai TaxID=54128 RepID=A0ABD2XMK4_9HYME
MSSRKSAQERKKSESSRHQSSDLDEVEDISSQSFADDSDRHSRRMHKDKRSSTSEKHKRKTDIDSEDEYVDDQNHNVHKKKRHKKHHKSESRESTEGVLSDDVFGEKTDATSREDAPSKRRNSRKRDDNVSYKSGSDRDVSVKNDSSRSAKKKRRRQGKPEELPITEILKKAQEQRTKYEEPLPLPELTTDTMYVQRQSGFSAIRISGQSQNKHPRRNSENPNQPSSTRPIEVAIFFQRIWTSAGFIFQGLLGGMAMLHLIFMQKYFDSSEEFLGNYSVLSETYSSAFSFLIAMCLISTFDKFDLAHFGRSHYRYIFNNFLKSIPSVPLYLAAFSIHQVTLEVDDKLTLIHYNSSNQLMDTYNITNGYIDNQELEMWKTLTLSKDALVIFSWIFVSLDGEKDMLLSQLKNMNKHS